MSNNDNYTIASIDISKTTLELIKNQRTSGMTAEESLNELVVHFKDIIKMYSRSLEAQDGNNQQR